MRKIVLLICVVTSTFGALAQQKTISFPENGTSPKASLKDVSWIAGHWQGEALGGLVEEIWSPPQGNSMMASFKMMKEGKVQFYEIMTITEEEETLLLRLKHFGADLKGWEEKDESIDFKLVEFNDNIVYFDDFTFERLSDNEINVYVVFGSGGDVGTFNYKRVTADH